MTPNAILQLINLVRRINSQLVIQNSSTAVAVDVSCDAEGDSLEDEGRNGPEGEEGETVSQFARTK